MSTINDGGPAFPVSTSNEAEGHQDGPNTWQHPGMALRDYFAAKAMQGLVSGHFAKYGYEDYWLRPEIAREAYEIADAMLAACKPSPNQ